MIVSTDESGAVRVKGCFGHIGHDLDPSMTRWTPLQEEYLKNLINGTISESSIMSKNCEEMRKIAEFQNSLSTISLKC